MGMDRAAVRTPTPTKGSGVTAVLSPVVSPDGRRLLCCRAESFASDLMIVDRLELE